MRTPRLAVICSHRLGEFDGVSIESAKWEGALRTLGYDIRTVAGAGTADVILPGLGIAATTPLTTTEITAAFDGADLVIVENVCSLKLNVQAAETVADALVGRKAVLHHHDLATERADRRHLGPPRDDPNWIHVCISHTATHHLRTFDIVAATLYNHFDPNPAPGDRAATRQRIGVGDNELLFLQPTRAIARKAIDVGLDIAEALRATYWILGPTEDGYDGELSRILSNATTRVIRHEDIVGTTTINDAYAACDLVSLPSLWEGFGNPTIESATHHRPLAIGDYPVARELQMLGFRWLRASDHSGIRAAITSSAEDLAHDADLSHNAGIARLHFSLADLPKRLDAIINRGE